MKKIILLVVIIVIGLVINTDIIFPEKIVYKEYCKDGKDCRLVPCEVSYENDIPNYFCNSTVGLNSADITKPISVTCFSEEKGDRKECEIEYNK